MNSPIERSFSDFTPSPHHGDVNDSSIPPIRLDKSMIRGHINLPSLNYAIVIRDLSSV